MVSKSLNKWSPILTPAWLTLLNFCNVLTCAVTTQLRVPLVDATGVDIMTKHVLDHLENSWFLTPISLRLVFILKISMFMLVKIYQLIFCLILITKCIALDYCSYKICNNSKQHTLCKYSGHLLTRQCSHPPSQFLRLPHNNLYEKPSNTCLSYKRTILTDWDRQEILNKINERRNKVAAGEIRSLPPAAGMMKLEWNVELEKSAQRWADQCIKAGDLQDSCRDLVNIPVGQNVATVQGDSPGLKSLALVDVWYMELLNTNSTVISRYVPSSETNEHHYDYFTQLMWAESTDVGCGGVKFQERLEAVKYRTIYRMVCNFAPAGNHRNRPVYTCGSPCSACSAGVCTNEYPALCEHKALTNNEYAENVETTTSEFITKHGGTETKNTTATVGWNLGAITLSDIDIRSSENESLTFDFFLNLQDSKVTREYITATTKETTRYNDTLLNDFINLLKNKLTIDSMFKHLLLTKLSESTSISVTSFDDEGVAAFVDNVYITKGYSNTVKTTTKDYVNSTLLIDLIEAVIFRNNDKLSTSETYNYEHQTLPAVKHIKVQAELAEVKQNKEFTGHYFFPEDEVETGGQTTESYYDNTNLAEADVEMEIEHLKMSSITRDFWEDIFESDWSTESTTIVNTLLPDKITLNKKGYWVMKKFLNSIANQSDI